MLTYADQDFTFTITYTDQGPQYTHGLGLTYADQDLHTQTRIIRPNH